jgi:hypothetical protein
MAEFINMERHNNIATNVEQVRTSEAMVMVCTWYQPAIPRNNKELSGL